MADTERRVSSLTPRTTLDGNENLAVLPDNNPDEAPQRVSVRTLLAHAAASGGRLIVEEGTTRITAEILKVAGSGPIHTALTERPTGTANIQLSLGEISRDNIPEGGVPGSKLTQGSVTDDRLENPPATTAREGNDDPWTRSKLTRDTGDGFLHFAEGEAVARLLPATAGASSSHSDAQIRALADHEITDKTRAFALKTGSGVPAWLLSGGPVPASWLVRESEGQSTFAGQDAGNHRTDVAPGTSGTEDLQLSGVDDGANLGFSLASRENFSLTADSIGVFLDGSFLYQSSGPSAIATLSLRDNTDNSLTRLTTFPVGGSGTLQARRAEFTNRAVTLIAGRSYSLVWAFSLPSSASGPVTLIWNGGGKAADDGFTLTRSVIHRTGIRRAAWTDGGAQWGTADLQGGSVTLPLLASSVRSLLVPAGGSVGQFVTRTATGSGWGSVELPAPATFLTLPDTPSSFGDNRGRPLVVNDQNSAVIFGDALFSLSAFQELVFSGFTGGSWQNPAEGVEVGQGFTTDPDPDLTTITWGPTYTQNSAETNSQLPVRVPLAKAANLERERARVIFYVFPLGARDQGEIIPIGQWRRLSADDSWVYYLVPFTHYGLGESAEVEELLPLSLNRNVLENLNLRRTDLAGLTDPQPETRSDLPSAPEDGVHIDLDTPALWPLDPDATWAGQGDGTLLLTPALPGVTVRHYPPGYSVGDLAGKTVIESPGGAASAFFWNGTRYDTDRVSAGLQHFYEIASFPVPVVDSSGRANVAFSGGDKAVPDQELTVGEWAYRAADRRWHQVPGVFTEGQIEAIAREAAASENSLLRVSVSRGTTSFSSASRSTTRQIGTLSVAGDYANRMLTVSGWWDLATSSEVGLQAHAVFSGAVSLRAIAASAVDDGTTGKGVPVATGLVETDGNATEIGRLTVRASRQADGDVGLYWEWLNSGSHAGNFSTATFQADVLVTEPRSA